MERIVVGVDGSETSQRALQWAVDEARVHDASVAVVNAWSATYGGGFPYAASAIDPAIFERAGQEVLDAAMGAVESTGVKVETSLVCGSAASSLIATAKGADLLVVGSRGLGGFSELLLGSVSHQVAHHAPCPVVIIPAANA